VTAGWRLDVTPPARRDLRRLDPPVRRRVAQALDRLVADPSTGDIIKLQGQDEHRLRVGDWRVLLRLAPDERTVYVLRVLPRGRAYER
jgi:mRNA interferase RelE/StbE